MRDESTRQPERRRTAMRELATLFRHPRLGPPLQSRQLGSDLVAAVIVTIMLIPQSLAYALLAGLPPEIGLYASILPLIAYAIFGTSAALAVGPVAVISLMTAAAVGRIAAEGSADYRQRRHPSGIHLGRDADGHGPASARLRRQFPLPSGDLGLHHRFGHHHRHQPDRGPAGHRDPRACDA